MTALQTKITAAFLVLESDTTVHHSWTAAEVAGVAGVTPASARGVLARLVRAGEVVRFERGESFGHYVTYARRERVRYLVGSDDLAEQPQGYGPRAVRRFARLVADGIATLRRHGHSTIELEQIVDVTDLDFDMVRSVIGRVAADLGLRLDAELTLHAGEPAGESVAFVETRQALSPANVVGMIDAELARRDAAELLGDDSGRVTAGSVRAAFDRAADEHAAAACSRNGMTGQRQGGTMIGSIVEQALADAADWAERNSGSLAEQLAEHYNCEEVEISATGVAIARKAGGPLSWIGHADLLQALARIGYGVTTAAIVRAATTAELDQLVERAAIEHDRDLERGESYAESAERLERDDDAPALAALLRVAEARWFEIDLPRANTIPDGEEGDQ